MKKRLRKKLHLGEFRVLGLYIYVVLHPSETTSPEVIEKMKNDQGLDFFDDFLTVIDERGLGFGGTAYPLEGHFLVDGVAEAMHWRSVNEEDVQFIRDYFDRFKQDGFTVHARYSKIDMYHPRGIRVRNPIVESKQWDNIFDKCRHAPV